MPPAGPIQNTSGDFLSMGTKVNRQSAKFIFAGRPNIRIDFKLRPDACSGSFLLNAHSKFNHGFAPLLVPRFPFIPSIENGKIQNSPQPASQLTANGVGALLQPTGERPFLITRFACVPHQDDSDQCRNQNGMKQYALRIHPEFCLETVCGTLPVPLQIPFWTVPNTPRDITVPAWLAKWRLGSQKISGRPPFCVGIRSESRYAHHRNSPFAVSFKVM